MATADETLKLIEMRRAEVLHKLVSLRRRHVDEAEFGRAAAPVIDSMISDEGAISPHRTGSWTDDERAILRAAYAEFGRDRAADEAAKKLQRTKSQIRAMAGNLGIKKPW